MSRVANPRMSSRSMQRERAEPETQPSPREGPLGQVCGPFDYVRDGPVAGIAGAATASVCSRSFPRVARRELSSQHTSHGRRDLASSFSTGRA
jgi:hypothetical protein